MQRGPPGRCPPAAAPPCSPPPSPSPSSSLSTRPQACSAPSRPRRACSLRRTPLLPPPPPPPPPPTSGLLPGSSSGLPGRTPGARCGLGLGAVLRSRLGPPQPGLPGKWPAPTGTITTGGDAGDAWPSRWSGGCASSQPLLEVGLAGSCSAAACCWQSSACCSWGQRAGCCCRRWGGLPAAGAGAGGRSTRPGLWARALLGPRPRAGLPATRPPPWLRPRLRPLRARRARPSAPGSESSPGTYSGWLSLSSKTPLLALLLASPCGPGRQQARGVIQQSPLARAAHIHCRACGASLRCSATQAHAAAHLGPPARRPAPVPAARSRCDRPPAAGATSRLAALQCLAARAKGNQPALHAGRHLLLQRRLLPVLLLLLQGGRLHHPGQCLRDRVVLGCGGVHEAVGQLHDGARLLQLHARAWLLLLLLLLRHRGLG